MALLSTYSAANRVVESDSVVMYSMSVSLGEFWVEDVFEYRRLRSKSYRYVGMDIDTARDCAAAAAAYYMRDKTVPRVGKSWDIQNVSAGKELMADIAIQRRGGNMYDVVINVHEDDIRSSKDGTLEPASLFTDTIYSNRKYDTEATAFA